MHLVPVCDTLPRNWQESVTSFSPEVWAAGAGGFCVPCPELGLPDLSILCAPPCLWYLLVLANIFTFDYVQNKVTPARVLGSSACAWVRPRSRVGPRLPSFVSQAIALARCAPPLSVADMGRHGLAFLRLY